MFATPLSADEKYVICIEPGGDICRLLNHMLNGKGFAIFNFPTIREAAQFDQVDAARLVIIENTFTEKDLPGQVGVVKTMAPRAKILMVSAADGELAVKAVAAGVNQFLLKPFAKSTLTDAVMHNLA